MQEYLHLFETAAAEQAAYTGSTYMEPWVSCVRGATGATFNKQAKAYTANAYRVNGGATVGGNASYTFTATGDLLSDINGTTYVSIPTAHTTFYTWANMDNVETPRFNNTASLASATEMTRSGNLWLFPETAITGTTLALLIRAMDGYKWEGNSVITDVPMIMVDTVFLRQTSMGINVDPAVYDSFAAEQTSPRIPLPSGNEFYNFNLDHVTPKVVDANGIEISAQYSLTGSNAWISWACAAENYGDFMTVYIALVADSGYQWNTSGDLYNVHR